MPETPAIKVFSERARESALRVRRHQSALGASEKPTGPGVQMGGVTVSPAIAARVREILAAKQGKGKKKAGGKGKTDAAKKKAEAAAKKAERDKERAAAKQEREKAKAERTAHQAQAKQERDNAKAERVAAQAKKQAEQQKKLKQAAQTKKQKDKASAQAKGDKAKQASAKQAEREKAAQAKQAERTAAAKERLAKSDAAKQVRDQAQAKRQAESDAKQKQVADRKKRVLSERIKRGEKLSASDQVDAEDAGLVKAGKAMDMPEYAIKQTDEERAMFAKMGGGRGKGKGYDKSKSVLTTGKDKAKGGGGGSSSESSSHPPIPEMKPGERRGPEVFAARDAAIASRAKARHDVVSKQGEPPAITGGSEKQQKFANDVRTRQLRDVEKQRQSFLEEGVNRGAQNTDTELKKFDAAIDKLRQRTDARWWIDNRDTSARSLIRMHAGE